MNFIKRNWGLCVAAVLLCAGGLAFTQRLSLLPHYLELTDATYLPDVRIQPAGLLQEDYLGVVLVRSACAGRVARLKTMWGAGFSPREFRMVDALACAAEHGQMETVRFLIERGAQPGADSGLPVAWKSEPRTALEWAVSRKDRGMAELLIAHGAKVEFLDQDGVIAQGPLHFAAFANDAAMVAYLVKQGADPVQGHLTPIASFLEGALGDAQRSASTWSAVIARAEAAGLKVDSVDHSGGTLLHWAASKGELALITLLLERGFDPAQKDKGGTYPFMRLAAWHEESRAEPPADFDKVLTALGRAVPDINARVSHPYFSFGVSARQRVDWSLAEAAAVKPAIRALYGSRIDYTVFENEKSGERWPLPHRDDAMKLVNDLSAEQLVAFAGLREMLVRRAWPDVVSQRQAKIDKAGLQR